MNLATLAREAPSDSRPFGSRPRIELRRQEIGGAVYVEAQSTKVFPLFDDGIEPIPTRAVGFRVSADVAATSGPISYQSIDRAAEALDRLVRDTQFLSSTSSIKAHPAFAEAVRFGDTTIRLILARMKARDVRAQWFPLLREISAENPVSPANRGYAYEMAKDWISWARGRYFF